MFRFARGFSLNTISRQKKCLCIRYNSTAIQEGEIELKSSPSQEEVIVKSKEIFDQAFLNAKDVPSLLKSATSKFKVDYAFKALDLLAELSDAKNISFEEMKKDVNYGKFVSVVEKQANSRHASEITNAIQNLKKLGVPDDNFLIESLENDLLWNVRKVSVHSLLLIVIFQRKHQKTALQKNVLTQTLQTIERRWTEVKHAREMCLIYGLANLFNANMLGNIDDLVIESAESMSLADLSKVIVSIGASGRRPTPVLRSLSFHMFKKGERLSPKQVSNLAFAMNALSFPDEALMGKLSADFLEQIGQVDQPQVIGTLLICMGQMRWRDKSLIDALADWIMANSGVCRDTDVASLFRTMASISYVPHNIDEILSMFMTRLNLESVPEKSNWIDIVWSLTVLGKVTSEQVSSVLDPSFVKDISVADPSCVGMLLKLLNINAAASSILESYDGPKLKLPSADVLLITKSRKDLSLRTYVHKVLRNFLPPPKYIKENSQTDMGFMVDAEFIMDKHCKPLALSEYSTAFGDIQSMKPLPEGGHRVALMIWNFKDFTLRSHSLTGHNALAVELLNKRGYKVVQIPYYDINKKDKILKSVQYFEKKIKETIY